MRQTLSYIRTLFDERGLKPKSKLGQNFLIDLNLLDVIVREAELSKEDLALEIGSGTGSLTARLADAAGAVVSVEIDNSFYCLTSELVAAKTNVMLLNADVLSGKNELNPEVLAALKEVSDRSGCRRVKLIANLPYIVATPVIGNLLLSDWAEQLERMVVTVQWEMAERLTAPPGVKDYSAVSVLVQSLADVEILRRLPPTVFWPRPQVASGIVRIRPNPAKRALIREPARFRAFLRDLYVHRRKNLRGALIGWPTGRRDRTAVDQLLAELGIDGTLRSEALDLEQHRRLYEAFPQE